MNLKCPHAALAIQFCTAVPELSMDTTFSVPVPKQKHPELTRDQRLRVQTLFFDANFTREQICLQTGYTYDQICYVIRHRLTPQKQRTGRRVFLNTPQRKRLIQWVTASEENRDTPWVAIPSILGFECGEKAIRTAFKKALTLGLLSRLWTISYTNILSFTSSKTTRKGTLLLLQNL